MSIPKKDNKPRMVEIPLEKAKYIKNTLWRLIREFNGLKAELTKLATTCSNSLSLSESPKPITLKSSINRGITTNPVHHEQNTPNQSEEDTEWIDEVLDGIDLSEIEQGQGTESQKERENKSN